MKIETKKKLSFNEPFLPSFQLPEADELYLSENYEELNKLGVKYCKLAKSKIKKIFNLLSIPITIDLNELQKICNIRNELVHPKIKHKVARNKISGESRLYTESYIYIEPKQIYFLRENLNEGLIKPLSQHLSMEAFLSLYQWLSPVKSGN
jgi:hypothetical protein